MATIPATSTYVAGEKPTAAKLNANGKTALDFLLNPPTFQAAESTSTAAANGTWTKVALPVFTWNNDGVTYSSGDISIKTAGLYLVTGELSFAANSTGRRICELYLNGVGTGWIVHISAAGGGGPTNVSFSKMMRFAVNDTLNQQVYQDSGGSLNTAGCYLQARWMNL